MPMQDGERGPGAIDGVPPGKWSHCHLQTRPAIRESAGNFNFFDCKLGLDAMGCKQFAQSFFKSAATPHGRMTSDEKYDIVCH